jgi:hypothetical protein
VNGNQCKSAQQINQEAAAAAALQEIAIQNAAREFAMQQQAVQIQRIGSGAIGTLLNFSSNLGEWATTRNQIKVPGALQDGILSAQVNAVRMTNFVWNPTAGQPSDPFAARAPAPASPSSTPQPSGSIWDKAQAVILQPDQSAPLATVPGASKSIYRQDPTSSVESTFACPAGQVQKRIQSSSGQIQTFCQ